MLMQFNTDAVTTLIDSYSHPVINELYDHTLETHTLLQNTISSIDKHIYKLLSKILQHTQFLTLEASWRGIKYVYDSTNTDSTIRLKVMQFNQFELQSSFAMADRTESTVLYKNIYSNEFNIAGGEPFNVVLADYYFSNTHDDIFLLKKLGEVASSSFCPVISAASSSLLGINDWDELNHNNIIDDIFNSKSYIQWQSLREDENSRFIYLTLPKILARRSYPHNLEDNPNKDTPPTTSRCWMNAAYTLGVNLANAYTKHGWCTAIRGVENGGIVKNIPMDDYGCPVQTPITDTTEYNLSHHGLLPLCYFKNTDYAVFFGANSLHKPKIYESTQANQNATISTKLPYIMATSRIAHYLKIIGRDKIGSFMSRDDVEHWMNRWILKYVNGNAASQQNLKAKYPLAEAKVKIVENPNKPGEYQAIAWLKPWLQLEQLHASLRLVAEIPSTSLKG